MLNNLINRTLNDGNSEIPVWFLRQAGRHIPEYFEIRRNETNFINFCLNEDLIINSTNLPLMFIILFKSNRFSGIYFAD